MADPDAQRLGRLGGFARAMALTPAERQASARRAAQARYAEMSDKPLITFEQRTKLGPEGISEIVDYIKQIVPGKSGLSLSPAQ